MKDLDIAKSVWRYVALSLPIMLLGCQHASEPGLVGTLERDRVELKVESSEPIIAIHVKDGQQVSAGDLVLEQDASRARAGRDQQAALYDQAAARLAELERGPRQEAIGENRARLEGLQAITVNAAAQLQRSREVFDRGLSDQAGLDRAEANWKSAQAQEKAAREALSALLHGTTIEDLQQAAAALAASKAVLDQAEIDLKRTHVYTSVTGHVDKVLFQLGERPQPGTTVAVVLDSARTFARVYVPEQFKSSVIPGMKMSVRIDGIEPVQQGRVRWVSSDASFTPYFALTEHDRSRLSYLAEIDLEDAGGLPVGTPLIVLPPEE